MYSFLLTVYCLNNYVIVLLPDLGLHVIMNILTESCSRPIQAHTRTHSHTGVDLSNILGGQTKILGEKVIKSHRCTEVSKLLGGNVPGLPPKSTPMHTHTPTPTPTHPHTHTHTYIRTHTYKHIYTNLHTHTLLIL